MTVYASFVQCSDSIDYTPVADTLAGQIIMLPEGRIGISRTFIAAGTLGALAISGLFDVTSASATVFSAGDDVFWDVAALAGIPAGVTASYRLGVAVVAKASGATTVRLALNAEPLSAVRFVSTADSSAVTNTTTETVVATYTIPANTLHQGSVIDFLAAFVATATNGTDTFQGRVRLGGVAGTVIADTTAIDLANGDQGVQMGKVVIREDGAAGTFVAAAQSTLKTTATPTAVQSTAIDTTAAIAIVLTITESVASASNSAKAIAFDVFVR